jgi:hypothetical protein
LFARVLDLEKRIAVIERGAGRTRIGLRVGLHVETAGRAGAGDFSR